MAQRPARPALVVASLLVLLHAAPMLCATEPSAAKVGEQPPAAPLCQQGAIRLDEPRGPPERASLPFCDQVRAPGALGHPWCMQRDLGC
jgi:hypothetical protein